MAKTTREQNQFEAMRRVQLGLVGLGSVLLLVGLINVVIDNVRRDNGLAPMSSVQQGMSGVANAVMVPEKPTEPLADLGVAPAPEVTTEPAAPVTAVPDLEPDPQLQKPMDRDPRDVPR